MWGETTTEEERDGGEERRDAMVPSPTPSRAVPWHHEIQALNLRNTTTKQRQREDPEPQTRNTTNAPDAYTKLIASCPPPTTCRIN